MVFPMVFLKIVAHWLLSCYREAGKLIKIHSIFHKISPCRSPPSQAQPPLYPGVKKCSLVGRESQTLVCGLLGTLLRSSSPFPYYMLVAFEGGSILRALLLLLSYPLLQVLNHEGLSLRVMTFISFCGLKTKDADTVARAVLPKFLLEDLNPHVYEVFACSGRRVVLTSVPGVMVGRFLKEYLRADEVVATHELQVVRGEYFTGFLSGSGVVAKHRAIKDLFLDSKPDLALGSSSHPQDLLFMSLCKEAYVVDNSDENSSTSTRSSSKGGDENIMPRHNKYPIKPLVFHDGRLAFFPTPLSSLTLFLWLPIGVSLAITRTLLGKFTPYGLRILAAAFSGVTFRIKGLHNAQEQEIEPATSPRKGVLYVCTHRTLLDPVAISTALEKPITAVTYSLSRVSELLAPIRTVRLTRDRASDGSTMKRLLKEGDLVVCPEGTTCREPYLLRFSPLFAELTDDIVPVAVDVRVTMFYGTTASGYKWLDPLFLLMNPNPVYYVQFLEKVPKERTCGGGMRSYDVANGIQRDLARALGFQCTALTRKDKYLMLAGNEGIVTK